jgi:hypothetical protein
MKMTGYLLTREGITTKVPPTHWYHSRIFDNEYKGQMIMGKHYREQRALPLESMRVSQRKSSTLMHPRILSGLRIE